jgi:transglutaminase-like putative cysteine protease
LATFAALALYGVVRWATLIAPAPTWRLLGLFALALALAAGVPPVRRSGRLPPLAVAVALCLLALPVAGLPWHEFVHVRIAVSARHIGDGLTGLANTLVPYAGTSHAVRLVIALGAAVLLLDAAIVIAFAPPQFGDARRAGAALPLIALAVVPSTLVRPQLPYLQGLVLFALLAAFMWGERVRRDAAGTAIVLASLAGVVAAVVAPRLDLHKPWIDYRAWAGTPTPVQVDSFDWNQTYGPLRWPRSGHVVMTVTARRRDYWKAENLDTFNGYAWVLGTQSIQKPLPPPSPSVRARWTQNLKVTIEGMETDDVIAAGDAAQPSPVAGGVGEGVDPGTWVAGRALGPGTTYEVSTYSPQPSTAELTHAGRHYPYGALGTDLTLSIPEAGAQVTAFPRVTFAPFHSSASPTITGGGFNAANPVKVVEDSPYGGAYALARRLAASAATPYAFVASVKRYLAHGYTYSQNPPNRRYPLVSFLFENKIGYCQQFSGAMALLLRMGGVPARVGAGFTSGTPDDATDQWVVTDIDAHAWVESWFPHYGWVRFDPTPPVAPELVGQTGLPILKRLPTSSLGARTAARRTLPSTPNHANAGRHASAGGPSPLLIVPALAVLAALVWLLRGRLRSRPSADDLLDELERALARTGRPLGGGVTLAALERRFHDSPAAAGYVRSLRLVRYGGASASPTTAERRGLREQLRQGLGLAGRVRALWALPPRPAAAARRRARRLKS